MSWNGILPQPAIAWPIVLVRTAILSLVLAVLGTPNLVQAADEAKSGLTDLGQIDKRWKGYQAPAGFRLEVVADEALVGSATTMATDDSGHLYVAEVTASGRTFDVWENMSRDDGSKLRLQKRRKSSFDQIKRLSDTDNDGRFDASEVVVEGIENPTALLWTKHALYATALGRLERWKDDDGDGRYESRTVLIDGFGALDARGLSGLTLGDDGYLYLTAGDNENHPFTLGKDPLDLAHTGGLWRCRPDGSDLQLIASGFRQPHGPLVFDGNYQPILLDDDGANGSRMAGVRLIQPSEAASYGWLTLTSRPSEPDLELGAVDGERPGRLPPFARLAGLAPASLVAYQGSKLPADCRGLIIAADPARHSIRGFKLGLAGSMPTLIGETTLINASETQFTPEQILVGLDSAIYILDRPAGDASGRLTPAHARIIRLSWHANPTGSTVAPASEPRIADLFATLTADQLIAQGLANPDHGVASQGLREMVDRGATSRPALMACAGNVTLPLHARLLGIQGARQFWNPDVEGAMLYLLGDSLPEVRRLAAQALAWEPKQATARLVPKLLDRLEDRDGRVVREAALAAARHAEATPSTAAPKLVRWLYAHSTTEAETRDAVLRAVERLGDVGVSELTLGVRTRRGTEREQAIRLYSAFRSAAAADELASLIKIPDLTGAERAILIRQYADFPAELKVATTPLVDWITRHPEAEPIVKLAALETCRLAGHPASAMVLALLDDEAESVRIAALLLAARTRPPGSMAKAADTVPDDTKSGMERLIAARSLRWGGPAGFAVLDAAYLGSDNLALRRAALRSMADADRAKALPALTSTLAGPDPLLRGDAITILGETPAGAVAAGQAYLDATLNRDDLPAVLRALEAHSTKEARGMLASVKQNATQGRSALTAAAIESRLAESGNPWAGMDVFYRGSSRCASCHQVGGKGGRSGPGLDLETHGLDAAKLIEAIQHPNRSIKSGYEPTRLAMAADRSSSRPGPLAGIDRKGGDPDPSKGLGMPTDLDLNWTTQEFADVVAFLLDPAAQTAVKQGGYAAIDQWAVAGPFALGGDGLRVPLDRFDSSRALVGLEGRAVSWLPLSAMPASGQVNLGGMFALEPSRVYLATQVRSPAAQTAWLTVSTQGAARVYLNGAKVDDRADHSVMDGHHASKDGVRVPLKASANLLLVVLDAPGTGEPLASFQLAAPQPFKVHAP